MLKRLSLVEDRYDALLTPYRKNADRIMLGMNCFLLLVCFGLAPLRDTWLAVAAIGLPTLALGASLVMVSAGRLVTRFFMACAFMAFTGLIIHQTGGDIEGHFSAFGLIGVLLCYRDWRTINDSLGHDAGDEAGVVARRFVKAISTPIRLDRVGEVVNIGVSVGVAHCDQGAATAEEILRQADGALYRAKHSGRGTVAAHDPAFAGKSVAEPLERVPAG